MDRTVESCELEGSGVGSVRTVGLAGGLKLQERLEYFEEAKRIARGIYSGSITTLREKLGV